MRRQSPHSKLNRSSDALDDREGTACAHVPQSYAVRMSKTEILNELPRLTLVEREEIRQRLAELDDENDDVTALLRAEELGRGGVKPKTQAEVFGNARAALK